MGAWEWVCCMSACLLPSVLSGKNMASVHVTDTKHFVGKFVIRTTGDLADRSTILFVCLFTVIALAMQPQGACEPLHPDRATFA